MSTSNHWFINDPKVRAVAECVAQKDIEHGTSQQIAERILNFELNVEHQRKLFLQSSDAQAPSRGAEPVTLNKFRDEIVMLEDLLLEQHNKVGRVTLNDFKLISKLKREVCKDSAKLSKLVPVQKRLKARSATASARITRG